MTIPQIKKQIEAIDNELSKDYTQYNIRFLKNRKIDLSLMLQEKTSFILNG